MAVFRGLGRPSHVESCRLLAFCCNAATAFWLLEFEQPRTVVWEGGVRCQCLGVQGLVTVLGCKGLVSVLGVVWADGCRAGVSADLSSWHMVVGLASVLGAVWASW